LTSQQRNNEIKVETSGEIHVYIQYRFRMGNRSKTSSTGQLVKKSTCRMWLVECFAAGSGLRWVLNIVFHDYKFASTISVVTATFPIYTSDSIPNQNQWQCKWYFQSIQTDSCRFPGLFLVCVMWPTWLWHLASVTVSVCTIH